MVSFNSIGVRTVLLILAAYSAIANVLDYTAGSFPVTFADRNLDPKVTNYTPSNLTDRSVWNTCELSLIDSGQF